MDDCTICLPFAVLFYVFFCFFCIYVSKILGLPKSSVSGASEDHAACEMAYLNEHVLKKRGNNTGEGWRGVGGQVH